MNDTAAAPKRFLDETPHLRWFEPISKCRMCGRHAEGHLRGTSNEDYGLHCKRCADKRLAASKKVREMLLRKDGAL